MREAIRLAKKWKRIEAPLAITAVFLSIIVGLILYAFQLPSTVILIIVMAIVFGTIIPIAVYYGNKIDKLTGYDKLRFKWDPVPGAEKEAIAIVVSGAVSLTLMLLGGLTPPGRGTYYIFIGFGIFCGVVIPLGNRIARKRHEWDKRKIPPEKQKAFDEIFEIMVYGEKKKKEQEEGESSQQDNSTK